jgi:hypothetical protein
MSGNLAKPWTLKGIPDEERNAAIAAARRAGLPIGAWAMRAFRTQIQLDFNESRSVTVVTEQSQTPSQQQPPAVGVHYGLAELLSIAQQTGMELDPRVQKLINLAIIDEMRDLRRARKARAEEYVSEVQSSDMHGGRSDRALPESKGRTVRGNGCARK